MNNKQKQNWSNLTNDWKNQNVRSSWQHRKNRPIEPIPMSFFYWFFGLIFFFIILSALSSAFPLIAGIVFATGIGLTFIILPTMMFFGYMQERRENKLWVPCSIITIMDLSSFVWKKKWHDDNEIGPTK